MNKTKTTVMLAGLALLGAAGAQDATKTLVSDLRLYQDFAEVRTPITADTSTLEVVWPQSAWSGLVPDSLELEGLTYTRALHTMQASWLESMKGRELTLREEGREPETVTLVRAEDVTVRDSRGEYRRVNAGNLAFPELPPERGYGALPVSTFDLAAAGAGTLSYLTRSLTWTPRYTLRVDGGTPHLTALADMKNGTDLAYTVDKVELLAGEVNLNRNYGGGPMYARAEMAMDVVSPEPASIQQEESLNGIYRYSLTETVTLPAESVVTLPFMQPKLGKFEAYVGLERSFSPRSDKGVLNRYYRLSADRALPGGSLTVREEGRVTGQTNIQETAAGQPVEFTLGRDPDVNYVRTAQLLRENSKQRVYEVTYTLENNKAEAVSAEISERTYGEYLKVEGQDAVAEEGMATLRVSVPAGGKVTRSFTITLDK